MSGVGTRGRGGEVFGRRTMSRSRRRRTRLWRTRRREGRKKRVKGKRKRMGNVEKREGRGERERAGQSEVEGFRKIGCKTRQDERGSERRDRERRRGGRNSFTFSRAHLVSLESSFPFSFLLLPSPQTPPPAHPPPPFSSVVMVGTWLKGTSHWLRWREKQRTARKSSPFQPSILLEPSSTSSKFYSLSPSGVVSAVDSGDRIVISGPPRPNGPPLKKEITLASLQAPRLVR